MKRIVALEIPFHALALFLHNSERELEKWKWKKAESKSNWRFRGIFGKKRKKIIAMVGCFYYFIFILIGLWAAPSAGLKFTRSIDRNKGGIDWFFSPFCLLLCGDCVYVFSYTYLDEIGGFNSEFEQRAWTCWRTFDLFTLMQTVWRHFSKFYYFVRPNDSLFGPIKWFNWKW